MQADPRPVWTRNSIGDRCGFGRRRKLGTAPRRAANAAAGRHSQLHGRAFGGFAAAVASFSAPFRGDGDLGGHSFGNLFLAALTEITGDFAEAVKLSSEILASKGHIYPATVADVRLAAELDDGSIVRGETNISQVGGKIKRLYPRTRKLPAAARSACRDP